MTYLFPYGYADTTRLFTGGSSPPNGVDPGVFERFYGEFRERVDKNIWPSFDFATNQWPAANSQRAIDLTEADLCLMSFSLLPCLNQPVTFSKDTTHKDLFDFEDGELFYEKSFRIYANAGSSQGAIEHAKKAAEIAKGSAGRLGRQVIFGLKHQQQRPRPYQTAFGFGKFPVFLRQPSCSASSASLPSGHAMQGMYACLGLYALHLDEKFILKDPEIEALKSLAVDIGDRRVFAGVHYPTDNLVSWAAGNHLMQLMFPTTAERLQAFWKESLKRSKVLAALRSSPFTVHLDAVDWFDSELRDPFVAHANGSP